MSRTDLLAGALADSDDPAVAGGAAMHCRELRIRLLESREARWVGINFLAFFE